MERVHGVCAGEKNNYIRAMAQPRLSPDGMSTEAIGILTWRRDVRMLSNGDLTVVPLKLKPNTASTTTWYWESISAGEGSDDRKGR